MSNFYPEQYKKTGIYPINHNYLPKQFEDFDQIWQQVKQVVVNGDFTLGSAVDEFESRFAMLNDGKFGVGVGSGTDALFLSLKALDIGPGDEVITTPFTFYATVGAIVTAGAKPVFVDITDDYNIDPNQIEAAITPRTKAIIPVHWAGMPCDMNEINVLANKYKISVVADACHAIDARLDDSGMAQFSDLTCFSMHPLKNLNVWGDGGIIVTNSEVLANKLYLMRNHGLSGRDECQMFAYNSRLDTIQAVVANYLLTNRIDNISSKRIEHSTYFDNAFRDIKQISLPVRKANKKCVFHLYMGLFEYRDELQRWLQTKGVDAKIHYPVPMHLQPAASRLGYEKGDFPRAEYVANNCLSLPVHEFISQSQQEYVVESIMSFYEQCK